MRHQWLLAVLSLTVLGGALRYLGAGLHSFWYDEAISALLVKAPYLDLLSGAVRDRGNPPLYWVAARAVEQAFGTGADVLRLFSVTCGTLTIPLLAMLGRRLLNPAAGLIAATLFASNPLSLELSTEARVYALLHFLIVANMVLLVEWLRQGSLLYLMGYALVLSALLLSHYYGLAVPLVQGLALLATARRRLLPWLAAAGLAAGCAAFWLPAFVAQLATPGNLSRQDGTWILQFLATPLVFGAGRMLVWRDGSLLLLATASLATGLAFWGPAVIGLWRTARRSSPLSAVLVGSWLVIPIALPFLAALAGKALYHGRAGSVALPALLLLGACGLQALPLRLRGLAVLAIGGLTLVSIYNFFTKPLNDDWHTATTALFARAAADQPVMLDPKWNVYALLHYTPDPVLYRQLYGIENVDATTGTVTGIAYRHGDTVQAYMDHVVQRDRPRNLLGELTRHGHVWLVLHRTGEPLAAYQALLRKHDYEIADSSEFHGLSLHHFKREGEDRHRGNVSAPAE